MSQEYKQICNTCGTVNDPYRKDCMRCGSILDGVAVTPGASSPVENKVISSNLSEKYKSELFNREMGFDSGSSHFSIESDVEEIKPDDRSATPVAPLKTNAFATDAERITVTTPSTKKKYVLRREALLAIAGMLILLFALTIGRSLLLVIGSPGPKASPTTGLPGGLGVTIAPNGQPIGVNDGSFQPFDVGPLRADIRFKQLAAQAMQQGNPQAAIAQWSDGLKSDTSDAEALIYIENQRAIASGNYVTLVLGMSFPDIGSQFVLQGSYIAQKAFNDGDTRVKLRLLIANTGGDPSYVKPVAQQVVRVAQQDHTVLGVLGWQTSPNTLNALPILAAAKIPVVSQTAVVDRLTNISPFFYRIASPDKVQVNTVIALTQSFHSTKAVVFEDPDSAYSQEFSQSFEQQFKSNGYQILKEEHFTSKKTTSEAFASLVHDALTYKPDVFVFVGPSRNDALLFQGALPPAGQFPQGLTVISGDTGFVASNNADGHWYFIAHAYPDEWETVMGSPSPFNAAYANAFDPYHQHKPNGEYYFTRPDSTVILSYDATLVFLKGIQIALLQGSTPLTPQMLADAFSQIKGSQGVQGVSGYIAFGPDHDPVDKAIVVLKLSAQGTFQLVCVKGGFLPGVDNASYSNCQP